MINMALQFFRENKEKTMESMVRLEKSLQNSTQGSDGASPADISTEDFQNGRGDDTAARSMD